MHYATALMVHHKNDYNADKCFNAAKKKPVASPICEKVKETAIPVY